MSLKSSKLTKPWKPDTATSKFDVFAHYARNVILKSCDKEFGSGLPAGRPPPKVPLALRTTPTAQPEDVVGIIGAGVGGLYAAMLLHSCDIPFEILEASDRTGGRVFTHDFSAQAHDYYDVGAMRFPESPVMQRLFHLFHCPQLNDPDSGIEVASHLIPYLFHDNTGNSFLDYNGTNVPRSNTAETFSFQATGVGQDALSEGAKPILTRLYAPFVNLLQGDLSTSPPGTTGWNFLMQFDKYSTRSYLAINADKSQPTINWLETMSAGTGWFDQALSESVLEWIAFGGDRDGGYPWWCLDGGSRVLPDAMTHYVNRQAPGALRLQKEVTGIKEVGPGQIQVQVLDEATPRVYKHVICTLPLPVLRTLDIDEAGLSVQQTNALRQLQYGPACKIGIKFKTPWWTDQLGIVGGQSYSDRCIRTTVYPSYGLDTDKTSVLIASYTWTHDALRLAALINPRPEAAERASARLKELVLREVARVHGVQYDMLVEQYVDHFAWDWTVDPLTQGAFAFFGPGEFSTLYQELCGGAAGGHLHFAGEALSVRHAWIVGALDSAWRAVEEVLIADYRDKIADFEGQWGHNEEWAEVPTDANAPETPLRSTLLLRYILSRHPSLARQ